MCRSVRAAYRFFDRICNTEAAALHTCIVCDVSILANVLTATFESARLTLSNRTGTYTDQQEPAREALARPRQRQEMLAYTAHPSAHVHARIVRHQGENRRKKLLRRHDARTQVNYVNGGASAQNEDIFRADNNSSNNTR